MIESVIMMLIYLCLFAIAVYLVLWVLEQLGITLPPQIMKILWVIVILVVILMVVRMFLPAIGVRVGGKLGAAEVAQTTSKEISYYATYIGDGHQPGKRIFCTDAAG